jgi:hypothetical protein
MPGSTLVASDQVESRFGAVQPNACNAATLGAAGFWVASFRA